MDRKPIMSAEEKRAYAFYLQQLYEATVGVLLVGAIATGDTTPAQAKTWGELTDLERQHFNIHVMPTIQVIAHGVYCVHGWEKP